MASMKMSSAAFANWVQIPSSLIVSLGLSFSPPSEWFTRKELQPEWAEDIARLPHVKAASSSMRIFSHNSAPVPDVRRGVNRAKNDSAGMNLQSEKLI
jgi:hypothetical protein